MPEIGLQYYKARIYNPKLGRFMQTDPVGYDDQMNLYAYVGNDPLNNTDPSGKYLKELTIIAATLFLLKDYIGLEKSIMDDSYHLERMESLNRLIRRLDEACNKGNKWACSKLIKYENRRKDYIRYSGLPSIADTVSSGCMQNTFCGGGQMPTNKIEAGASVITTTVTAITTGTVTITDVTPEEEPEEDENEKQQLRRGHSY